MKVNTSGGSGNISKHAKVYTNDPGNRIVRISIRGFVKVSISISPRAAYLGGFADDAIERVVTIRANNPASLLLEPMSFSLPDKVEYRIETVKEGRSFKIFFRNKSAAKERYNGFLKLKTNYPDKPIITIRVVGNILKKNQVMQGSDQKT